eukprot:3967554-Pleurochrysis_carterae.AAC.1
MRGCVERDPRTNRRADGLRNKRTGKLRSGRSTDAVDAKLRTAGWVPRVASGRQIEGIVSSRGSLT